MPRLFLLAGLVTVLVLPRPSAAASTIPAAIPPPAPAVEPRPSETVAPTPSPWPQIGLGSLQLLAGYGVGIGGMAALLEAGVYPKNVGIHSDLANLAFVGLLAPALTSAGVCGTGYLSSRYRGRCATTVVGAYAGAVVGALLGFLMAPAPGPDDTAEFTNTMAAIAGAALFMPIGAVAGWHLGKEEIPPPATASATAWTGRNGTMPARQPMVPVLGLSW